MRGGGENGQRRHDRDLVCTGGDETTKATSRVVSLQSWQKGGRLHRTGCVAESRQRGNCIARRAAHGCKRTRAGRATRMHGVVDTVTGLRYKIRSCPDASHVRTTMSGPLGRGRRWSSGGWTVCSQGRRTKKCQSSTETAREDKLQTRLEGRKEVEKGKCRVVDVEVATHHRRHTPSSADQDSDDAGVASECCCSAKQSVVGNNL